MVPLRLLRAGIAHVRLAKSKIVRAMSKCNCIKALRTYGALYFIAQWTYSCVRHGKRDEARGCSSPITVHHLNDIVVMVLHFNFIIRVTTSVAVEVTILL